jgi:hypothetical protein
MIGEGTEARNEYVPSEFSSSGCKIPFLESRAAANTPECGIAIDTLLITRPCSLDTTVVLTMSGGSQCISHIHLVQLKLTYPLSTDGGILVEKSEARGSQLEI